MSKPRIFVSSTYYDLKHIRNSLDIFIKQFGYDPVLFENGDIHFDHTQPLDTSCYSEILSCHILVLIIGGRYGSQASDTNSKDQNDELDMFYKSITTKEYEAAREKDIPIYIFVEKSVMSEYKTYKENKENKENKGKKGNNIKWAHVDSIGVFHLLDDITQQQRNNLIREFEKFDDISSWLMDQWAGMFADFLSKKSSETTLKNLSNQIDELKELTGVLKSYNESIINSIEPKKSKKIISDSDKKLERDLLLAKFRKEDLINYIFHQITSKKRLPNIKIYKIFQKSTTLEGFLDQIEVNDDSRHWLIKKAKGPTRDYARLKTLYNIEI